MVSYLHWGRWREVVAFADRIRQSVVRVIGARISGLTVWICWLHGHYGWIVVGLIGLVQSQTVSVDCCLVLNLSSTAAVEVGRRLHLKVVVLRKLTKKRF